MEWTVDLYVWNKERENTGGKADSDMEVEKMPARSQEEVSFEKK